MISRCFCTANRSRRVGIVHREARHGGYILQPPIVVTSKGIPMTDTLIDLIRHGTPEGGRAYRGHGIDDLLSEKGWAQMWAAVGGEAAESVPWTRIVSSPLARCSAFAEALGARHGLPVAVDTRFREVGFGRWEGRTPDQIQRDSPDEYAAFFADPVRNRPPAAEPLEAFVARHAGPGASRACTWTQANGHAPWSSDPCRHGATACTLVLRI